MNTFIARTPVDLLAMVPLVIGFHPEESVVLLTVGEVAAGRAPDRPASFHARADLPRTADQRRELVATLRAVTAQHRATLVGLVVYTEDVAAARRFSDLVVPVLLADQVAVIDVLRVHDGRFFAVDDPEDPGTTFDLSRHPFTAQSVLEGRVVHDSRTALRASLVGTDQDAVDQVGAAATALVDALVASGAAGESLHQVLTGHATWLQGRICEYVAVRGPVSVDDAARMLVLVSFQALREVAWAAMSRATAREQVELWCDLVRRAPADLRAGAGGLLAFAAWLAGDGALAWCAVECCRETEPTDVLARHVAVLLESATPPSVWTPVAQRSLRVPRRQGAT